MSRLAQTLYLLVPGALLWGGCGFMGYFELQPQERCTEPGAQRRVQCATGDDRDRQYRFEICRDDGHWVRESDCRQLPCEDVGASEERECEPLYNLEMVQRRTCREDYSWTDWSACESRDRCQPGDTRNLHAGGGVVCGPCLQGAPLFECGDGTWVFVRCVESPVDADGDGYTNLDCAERFGACCTEIDCDDDDPETHPGAVDVAGDDLDQDCSGWPFDLDGDGDPALFDGGSDCVDTDPERTLGEADLDGDGLDLARCGGEDCDDDCASCRPDGISTCGAARDHDCDGVIDEMTGCGDCAPGALVATRVDGAIRGRAVFVSGDRAYVTHDNGLGVFDLSTPGAPTHLGDVDVGGTAWGLAVYGDLAVVGTDQGLATVDLAAPSFPLAIGRGLMSTEPQRGVLAALGPDLFVHALHVDGLGVPDDLTLTHFGLPSDPRPIGSIDLDFAPRDIFVAGRRIYSASFALGVHDVSDPREPLELGSELALFEEAHALFIDGDLAYVAASDGLFVLNVSDPTTMALVGHLPAEGTGSWYDMFVAGGYAYVTGQLGHAPYLEQTGLAVIDVSPPTAPELVTSVPLWPTRSVAATTRLFVSGGFAYVVGESDPGLYVVDLGCGD